MVVSASAQRRRRSTSILKRVALFLNEKQIKRLNNKGLYRDLPQLFRLDFVETSAVVAAFGNQFGGLDSF